MDNQPTPNEVNPRSMGVRHRARANHLTNWKPFDLGRAPARHVHNSERSELTLSLGASLWFSTLLQGVWLTFLVGRAGIVRLNYQRPIATTVISTNPEHWNALRTSKFYMGF